MASTTISSTITAPTFIDSDVNTITSEIISEFEATTGKTLQPAQDERLLVDEIAYRESLCKIGINQAALKNLVTFSSAPMLDYLGELVDCPRIEAQYAKTTMQFSIDEARSKSVTYASGTQIETKDGNFTFTTTEDAVIAAGELSATASATCDIAGSDANGYLAGEINLPLPTIDADSVKNITTSSGGADKEGEDAYKARIIKAPESFSNAGSKGAYIYFAESAHQDIIDVAVYNPQTPASVKVGGVTIEESDNKITGANVSATVDYQLGKMILTFPTAITSLEVTIPPAATVEVYPLTKEGAPTDTIITAVENALNAEKIRPLTDNVIVKAPVKIAFVIKGTVQLYSTADRTTVIAAVESSLDSYISTMKTSLAKDIVPAQIISKILAVDGVYNATLSSPSYQELNANEWAGGSYDLEYEVVS